MFRSQKITQDRKTSSHNLTTNAYIQSLKQLCTKWSEKECKFFQKNCLASPDKRHQLTFFNHGVTICADIPRS